MSSFECIWWIACSAKDGKTSGLGRFPNAAKSIWEMCWFLFASIYRRFIWKRIIGTGILVKVSVMGYGWFTAIKAAWNYIKYLLLKRERLNEIQSNKRGHKLADLCDTAYKRAWVSEECENTWKSSHLKRVDSLWPPSREKRAERWKVMTAFIIFPLSLYVSDRYQRQIPSRSMILKKSRMRVIQIKECWIWKDNSNNILITIVKAWQMASRLIMDLLKYSWKEK